MPLTCKVCGAEMVPLFTSVYCPDCDDYDPKEEKVVKVVIQDFCPWCGADSSQVEPFDPGKVHCWTCGRVW